MSCENSIFLFTNVLDYYKLRLQLMVLAFTRFRNFRHFGVKKIF